MMFLSFDLPLFPVIPLMIIVPLLFTLHKRSSSSSATSTTHKNHPPSPRKLPIIGNLHQLGSQPRRFLQALSKIHGPLVLIQLGSVPAVVASSPEAAREILKTHDVIFSNRPILRIPDTLTYGSKSIAFSPYGEYWRQVRSIAVLGLLTGSRVRSFKRVREEETRLMFDKIRESCGSNLVDLSDLLNSLTNNIVCRVALGRKYHGMKVNDMLQRFVDLLGEFSIGNYIPWLSFVDRVSGLEARTKKVAQEIDEVLEIAIEEHVRKRAVEGDVGGGSDETYDLVDILLDAQKANTTTFTLHRYIIKAAVMDMFAAGTDTTFAAIEWTISELIRHPEVMKTLLREIREIAQEKSMISEDDLEKMHYLQAVIKETLRLHTPLPLLIFRESTQDVKVMGYDIAAGTQVIINAWAMGRDPSLWEEAEVFRPERFMNSSIEFKGLHFEYLPFGGGRRGCPGIQFATVIVELAIANLVYKYDLALPDGMRGEELDMSEVGGLTMHREFPLLVVATPRF